MIEPMRVLLGLAVLGLMIAMPPDAGAQPAAKTYRIGVLANALDTADGTSFQAFLGGLRQLGYVENTNFTIEWRSSEGEFERLPGLAAELVRAQVDVILATALQPAQAAAEATKTIPIVFVIGTNPLGQRVVDGLARRGGNVTGLATELPEQVGAKVFQSLREAVPSASRVAVLTNPTNPAHREFMAKALPSAAERAKVVLVPLEFRSAGDVQAAIDAAVAKRVDGLYVLTDVLSFIYRARIVDLVARSRLPAVYGFRAAVEAGGLMSYGPDVRDLFGRAATYVDKILKGARPGDLPVQQPTKFELGLNLKTAKALGIMIPSGLRQRADYVVE
jgi:putative ABC transport system substrate-binding protein